MSGAPRYGGPVGLVFTRSVEDAEAFLITVHDGSGARHAKPAAGTTFASVIRGPGYHEEKERRRRDKRSRRPSAAPMGSPSPVAAAAAAAVDRERDRTPPPPGHQAAAAPTGGGGNAEDASPAVRIFLLQETIYNGSDRTLTIKKTYLNPDGSSECITNISRNHNGNIPSQESDGSGLHGPKRLVNRMIF